MKEKVENILGGFLERNKDYAIHVYIRNGITNNIMVRLLIPIGRNKKSEKKEYLLRWKVSDIECNNLSFLYEEIIDCYENNCEDGGIKISENVVLILKNENVVEFECCGDSLQRIN